MAGLIANVLRAKNVYAIITKSESIDGFLFDDGECSVLSAEASDRELGSLVLAHVRRSAHGQVVEPRYYNGSVAKALRCRGWREVERIAECVIVRLFPESCFEIERMLKDPDGGGFVPNASGMQKLSVDASDEAVGKAVREAMLARQ